VVHPDNPVIKIEMGGVPYLGHPSIIQKEKEEK
jgi:hypothetical protein